jgi:hypothetical protein
MASEVTLNASGTISFAEFCRAMMRNETVQALIHEGVGVQESAERNDILRELAVDQPVVSEPPSATSKKTKTGKKKKAGN